MAPCSKAHSLDNAKSDNYTLCMNELQSNGERTPRPYRPRRIAPLLQRRLRDFPVLVLTGPRQAGKTTLLRHEPALDGFHFVDLDDLELRGRLELDPALAWRGHDRVVIDEVHRLPVLLEALKSHVDRHRERVRVVVTGSANLLLMRDVAESLAGRAAYLELMPFGHGEWHGDPPSGVLEALLAGELPPEGVAPCPDAAAVIARGLLPPALLAHDPVAWWDAYVRTAIERDLRALVHVQSLPDFRRLMGLLALRTAQTVNTTELSRTLQASQPTVHRHLNLLEVGHLVTRLPAWMANRGKRIARRAKLHLVDPGLAAFLAGLHDPASVRDAREAGALFETLVHHHLRLLASTFTPAAGLHHWRTSDGKEVDLVLAHGRHLIAVECKWTDRPLASHARNLRLFRQLHPECVAGVVVHAGERIEHLGGGIVALPWSALS